MKAILLSIILFGLTGCYTVIWKPNEQMPASYQKNEFYNSDYYGEYYDYYDTPWWILNPINIYAPSQSLNNETTKRDKTLNNVRNQSGDRNVIERERVNSGRNEYTPPAPVSVSGGNNQGSNNSNSQNNNSGSSSTVTNEEQNRTRSNNNDSNSVRNENGNRNSGNSRR